MGGKPAYAKPEDTVRKDMDAIVRVLELPSDHKDSLNKMSLSNQLVLMGRITNVLEGLRKRRMSDDERGAYDSLENARRKIVQNFHDATTTQEGKKSVAHIMPQLTTAVSELTKNMKAGREKYFMGESGEMLLELKQNLETSATAPEETLRRTVPKRSGVRTQYMRSELRIPDVLGRIHLIDKGKDYAYLSATPVNTDTTAALWIPVNGTQAQIDAARTTAGNIIGKLAQGAMLVFNDPTSASGAAGNKLAKEMYDILNSLPQPTDANPYKNSEIWNNQNFKDALTMLKLGKLKEGMELLGKVGPLAAPFSAVNNTRVIRIGRRALTIFSAETTFVYQYGGNVHRFEEFLANKEMKQFDPALLGWYVGFAVNMLALAGVGQELVFDGGVLKPKAGSERRLTGTGMAYEGKAGATGAFGAWGVPFKFTLHCSAGYRTTELSDPTGGPQATMKAGDAYLGVLGLEMELPGKLGQRWPVRLERVGIAQAGTAGFNPIMYATISAGRVERDKWGMNIYMTPTLSYLLDQTRIGIKTEAEFRRVLGKSGKFAVSGGPQFEYTYNKTTGVHELTASGKVSFKLTDYISLYGEAGYYHETGNLPDQLRGAFGVVGVRGTFTRPSEARKRSRGLGE